MYITLNSKFDPKKMLPPLAHGQSHGGLDTETPRKGVQTQQWGKKKIDHQYQAVASNITPSMKKSPS
jgi:hypothetical protein